MNFKSGCLVMGVLGMIVLPVGAKAAPNSTIGDKGTVAAALTNNEVAKQTNPVILDVQWGETIDRVVGDVDGDGKAEEVLLMGSQIVKGSHFMGELYVIIKDLEDGKIKAYLRPQNCGGYDSFLTLTDVTGDGIDNVIITAPTGGSSGTIDLRVLDFSGGEAKEIFTKENNNGVAFVGKYLPNYKAELIFPAMNRDIVIDLSSNKELYNNLNIYTANGNVKESGVEPYMEGFSSVITIDTDDDGTGELLTTQRIVGPINMDTLGYVRTIWKYMAGNWQERQTDFGMNLVATNSYNNDADILGPSGYLIRRQDVGISNSLVYYPHVLKMGTGYQQGRLNGQVDTFIKKVMGGISSGDQVQMGYEIKYAGSEYLSVLFTGVKTNDYKNIDIKQTFNFDMETGESITLETLLSKQTKFWAMIKEETAKKGIALDKVGVEGFYYDGDCLVLLYNDKEEFVIAKKILELYVKKDKMDKYLTR